MNSIIYIIGLIVVIGVVLSFFGLRQPTLEPFVPGEYTGPPIGLSNSCSGEQSREAVERTISQTQQGFGAFIAAANNSVSMMPHPTTYMSLKAISLTEQSVKAVFDHAKALLHANAMKLQDRIFEGTIRRRNRPAKAMGGNVQRSSPDRSGKDIEIK